jgi:hypothetical protein
MRFKLKQGKTAPKEFIIPKLPPVWYDQGNINSCVGHALAFCISYLFYQQTARVEVFSPMYVYWHARYLRGLTQKDDGCFLIDGIISLTKWGICREKSWEHNHTHLTLQPSPAAYEDAMSFALTVKFAIIKTVDEMKNALVHHIPVVFGFPVPESFKRSLEGTEVLLEPPKPSDRILGGHAVVAIGYSDYKNAFLCRNSWGKDWGVDGNFWLHYDYVVHEYTDAKYALKIERRRPTW